MLQDVNLKNELQFPKTFPLLSQYLQYLMKTQRFEENINFKYLMN